HAGRWRTGRLGVAPPRQAGDRSQQPGPRGALRQRPWRWPGLPACAVGARTRKRLPPAAERSTRAGPAGDRAMSAPLRALAPKVQPMKVLIVDDTRLARQELRTLLAERPGVGMVWRGGSV